MKPFGSVAPVMWVILSEIYPNRIRGTAMSLVAVTIWVMVQKPPGGMVPEVRPTVAPPLTPPVSVDEPPVVQTGADPAAALVMPVG